MTDFNAEIESFRLRLRATVQPSDPGRVVDGWLATTGRLVLTAASREGNPFTDVLSDFRTEWASTGLDDAAMLIPRPQSSNTFFQAWWRLQLLLYAAAVGLNQRPRVCDLLQASPGRVAAMVDRARAALAPQWNMGQWADHLGDAVLILRETGRVLPFAFDGRTIAIGDREVRLSEQESVLFRALLDAMPAEVSFDELIDRGVPHQGS